MNVWALMNRSWPLAVSKRLCFFAVGSEQQHAPGHLWIHIMSRACAYADIDCKRLFFFKKEV